MNWSKEDRIVMTQDYSKLEERRKRKLSLRQRRFLKYYLETGNACAAAKKAYGLKYNNNASLYADRILKSIDFNQLLEMAGVSDSELAVKMTDGLNANKITRDGVMIPDLELRHKYLVTALEAKRKIKNKLEVSGENGQPIRFNILAGQGFVPTVPRPESINATSEASVTGGSAKVQNSSLAQTSPQNNNSNN